MSRRCHARRKSTGERCPNPAIGGGRVCERHGGLAPQVKRKAELNVAERDLSRFVKPLDTSHELADPVYGLYAEYLRTQGRLVWLGGRIAELREQELTWGITKEERINASETPGTNRTYESRLNLLIDLEDRERKHLLAVEKLLIDSRFREAELAIAQKYVGIAYRGITAALKALGLDPADPEVMDVLAREVLAAEPERPALPSTG
jgi:hypothetical protein